MKTIPVVALALFVPGYLLVAPAPPKAFTPSGFAFEKEIQVPLDPVAAFDAFTGDISPWWDHSFSKKPARLVIEPKPGGHFMEIFDEAGNGVVHARVTWADRGKKLVFRGALGPFHSLAADLVHTFEFEKTETGTRIKASIRCMGEFDAATEPTVSKVWDHFLVERFKAHAEKLAAKKGN